MAALKAGPETRSLIVRRQRKLLLEKGGPHTIPTQSPCSEAVPAVDDLPPRSGQASRRVV